MTGIVRGTFAVLTAALLLSFTEPMAYAAGFSSGSTGADGAFSPTANTTLTLPPNGVFNFTTVDIPAGVTVKFVKNAANTPVHILTIGNVTIAGTIDISGGNSVSGGPGTSGDRSLPGIGGPGGYDGGRGGIPETLRRAGNGLGPGGGAGGDGLSSPVIWAWPQGGGGGGYSVAGNSNDWPYSNLLNTGLGGPSYGSNLLSPLVGGSGGGGGAGGIPGDGFHGTGGGGGGGAILIAASGAVTLSGSILANGGNSGPMAAGSNGYGGTGGGGSGGAVRIAAPNIGISGTVNVNGGIAGANGVGNTFGNGGTGARGRTNIETVSAGTLSLLGLPTLAFTSVAGVTAPAVPTGAGDVILPATEPNPATVVFATTGVPVGNTVKLTLTPQRGVPTTVTSAPLTGTLASGTTSVAIDIPQGFSTLLASTSYTISVAMGDSLSRFANNERVERIHLSATLGGPSKATLVTVSGKEYDAPDEALRIATIQ